MSPCGTSLSCARSTWCAVMARLRCLGNTLLIFCHSRASVRSRNRRQVLPLTGVADLDRCDLVGVARARRLHIPLGVLQHVTLAAEPYPGKTADREVSAVTTSLETGDAASAVTSRSPALLERLNPDQRSSFLHVWARPPPHLRESSTYLTLDGPPRQSIYWVMCSLSLMMCPPPRKRTLGVAP